jgi:predicted MPP superfamily phosphohydrolase
MRVLFPAWSWRVGLALVGAAAIWVLAVNRVILNWTDSPQKVLTLCLLAVGLGALALVPAWSSSRLPRVWPWLLVLALLAVGEVQRFWLRRAYLAEAHGTVNLFSPVTTTALRTHHFTLAVRGLPAKRLRVVHLTDLHLSEELPAAYPIEVLHRVRAAKPDLLLLTGDYLSRAERLPLLESWLSGLPTTRYGAFAVLGNHDYWSRRAEQVRALLERAGVRMLGGECARIVLDAARDAGGSLKRESLSVCGNEAPWGPALEPERLKQAVKSSFATLVLSHTPDNVYDAAELGATAVFAGHTHGGQMRLPGLGALIVPSRYGRRFDRGRFVIGSTRLFVSAGVGADAPPLRLWCPPEILVVELLPASAPE